MTTRRVWGTVFVGSLLLLLSSCGNEVTQIVVRVDTDLRVPCDIDTVAIDIPGEGLKFLPLRGHKLPVQIPLVNGPKGAFSITVLAYRGSDTDPVIEQEVRLPGFQKNKSLLALVRLSQCVGACAPITFEQGALDSYRGLTGQKFPNGCGEETCNGLDDDGDTEIDEGLNAGGKVCGTCDTPCYGGLICSGNACRSKDVLRYEVKGATGEIFNACSTPSEGDFETVVLFDSPGQSDDVAYRLLYDPTGATPSLEFYFYGRRVYGVWISAQGWIQFDTDPGDNGRLEVPATNKPFDDTAVPSGIYPFWRAQTLTSSGQVCMSIQHKSEEVPDAGVGVSEILQVRIEWAHTCFDDTLVSGKCPSQGETLDYSVQLNGRNGQEDLIELGWHEDHNSEEFPDLAQFGSEPGKDVTIGLRDEFGTTDVACAPDACDAEGLCSGGDTACGYTDIPDPRAESLWADVCPDNCVPDIGENYNLKVTPVGPQ